MAASQQPPWLHSAAAAAPHKRLHASMAANVGREAESVLPTTVVAQQQQRLLAWEATDSSSAGGRVSLQQALDSGGVAAKRFKADSAQALLFPSSGAASAALSTHSDIASPAGGGSPRAAAKATGVSCLGNLLPTEGGAAGVASSSFPSSTTAVSTGAVPSKIALPGVTERTAAQVERVGDFVAANAAALLKAKSDCCWKDGEIGESASSPVSCVAPGVEGEWNKRIRKSSSTLPGHDPRSSERMFANNTSLDPQPCGDNRRQKLQLHEGQPSLTQNDGRIQATSLLLNRQPSEQDRLAIVPFATAAATGSASSSGIDKAATNRDLMNSIEKFMLQGRDGATTAGGLGTEATMNNRNMRFRTLTDLLSDKEIQTLLRMHVADPVEFLKAVTAAGDDIVAVAEILRRRGLQASVGSCDSKWLPDTLKLCHVQANEQCPKIVDRHHHQKHRDRFFERNQQKQQRTDGSMFGSVDMFFSDREMQTLQRMRSCGSGDTASIDSGTTTAGCDAFAGEDALMVEDEPVVFETEGSMKSLKDGE